MAYIRSASVQKFIDAAHTKLVVYYLDGNARTQWGRSGLSDGRTAADPRAVEIRRHERYVSSKAEHIKNAQIYDKATGLEIRRYANGSWS